MPVRGRRDELRLILRSVRTHGLRPTLTKARVHLDSAFFDRRYGVDSNRHVPTTELEIVGGNQSHGTFLQPIKPLVFKAAMRSLDIPIHGTFVDFGSGAGRALMLAALHGFQHVVGVEYAVNLNPLAERNLEAFRWRTGRDFSFRIVGMDAGDYPVGDDEQVFFFYNPFDRLILERVLANIRRSYETSPRSVHVVYANPTQRLVLDQDPFWMAVDEIGGQGLETFVHYRPRDVSTGVA